MTIKQILVHVEPGKTGERRLGYALSMAKSFGASLAGLSIVLSPAATAYAMMGDAQIFAAAAQASEESCAAARALFERATQEAGVQTEWREATGIPAEVVRAEAALADLVILGRGDRSDPDGAFYELSSADVILGCGRPVLVVSGEAPASFSARRALLAWKSAPQAARAIHDALPLLEAGAEVVLAEIVDQRAPTVYEVSVEGMADHLRAHGLKVIVRRIARAGDAGDLLIQVADELRCDMIVAGAYGHSRFREWVLGGVTDTLLHRGSLPCLLSH